MSTLNMGYIPADWSGAPSGGNALNVMDSEESGVSVVTLVLEGEEESRAFCDVAQQEGMFAVSAETLCDEEDDEAGRFLDWANECLGVRISARAFASCMSVCAQGSKEWEDDRTIKNLETRNRAQGRRPALVDGHIVNADALVGHAYIHFWDKATDKEVAVAIPVS